MLILIKISNVEEDVKTFFLIIYYNFTKKKNNSKNKNKTENKLQINLWQLQWYSNQLASSDMKSELMI